MLVPEINCSRESWGKIAKEVFDVFYFDFVIPYYVSGREDEKHNIAHLIDCD